MMSYRHPPDAYRIGALWSFATGLLLLTIMAWYANSPRTIARYDLAVFVAWVFAVPILALYINVRYR